MPRHLHAGFLIHVLTASGAALALLALDAAVGRHWAAMFMWLGIALLVDAADGPLARYFRIADTLPRWSGETLDLVVDFLTYVFVPAYAIAASGLLVSPFDLAAGVAITISGGLYFADRRMKTPDNYFRGFPALWNCIAFYLLLARPAPWLAGGSIALLVGLTFLPFPFIHPMRVRRLRALNLVLLALWAVLAAMALVRDMAPGPWVTGGLCAIGLYFFAAGVFRRSSADVDETA
ncbi:MAG TPA: phosphatidylcholine synthase [Xanthobacteraceae bacterium]|nr:phosphatidylcholine synthase [Xanthobacteraceae bacterium]